MQHGIRPNIAIPFVNKRVMKEKLKKHNLPQTPFISDINLAQKTFGFPLVLKPIDKDGSKGIFIIKDHTTLQKALTKIKAQNRASYYIAEKYIHGHDYMINAIVLNEQITFVMAVEFIDKCFDFYRKGKPYSFITVDSAEKKDLEALARQVIKKLGLRNSGIFIDCIKDQATGKFLITEVACRIGGGAYKDLIKKRCGVDMQSEGYRAQLGIPLKLSRKDETSSSQVLELYPFPRLKLGFLMRKIQII